MSAAVHLGPEPKAMTFEEFLLWEDAQEERHEFSNGEVLAMAGGSDNHELVAGNLFAELHRHLRGKGCRVYKGDMKLRFRAGKIDLTFYPDAMVTCDPADSHSHFKERPTFLAEVMSRFNQDHFEKLFVYSQIGSLEEYLVIGQDPAAPVAWLYRQEDGWAMPDPVHSGELSIACLDLCLDLGELYRT